MISKTSKCRVTRKSSPAKINKTRMPILLKCLKKYKIKEYRFEHLFWYNRQKFTVSETLKWLKEREIGVFGKSLNTTSA